MDVDGAGGDLPPKQGSSSRGPWGCLVEGFEVPEGAKGPMFPFPEEDLPWDEYGEALDAKTMAMFQASHPNPTP